MYFKSIRAALEVEGGRGGKGRKELGCNQLPGVKITVRQLNLHPGNTLIKRSNGWMGGGGGGGGVIKSNSLREPL